MIKIFDDIVNGKHVEKWETTEEEKAAAKARLEEMKKKRHDSERLLSEAT